MEKGDRVFINGNICGVNYRDEIATIINTNKTNCKPGLSVVFDDDTYNIGIVIVESFMTLI